MKPDPPIVPERAPVPTRAALALALLLSGCHLLLPLDELPGDAGALEAGKWETAPPDAGDGPHLDRAVLPEAGPRPDTRGPQASIASDLAPDSAVIDAGPPPPACNAQAKVVHTYRPKMVVCGSTAAKHDQCSAENLCNLAQGWTLCSPDQFTTRGGDDPLNTFGGAWVGGCVRNGATVTSPQPGPCKPCTLSSPGPASVAFDCGGITSQTSSKSPFGITSDTTCHIPGSAKLSDWQAFWDATLATQQLGAAVCCYP